MLKYLVYPLCHQWQLCLQGAETSDTMGLLKLSVNAYCSLCVTAVSCLCRTPVGRGRAWLRLALMQKKLSEYMKALINRKDLLR